MKYKIIKEPVDANFISEHQVILEQIQVAIKKAMMLPQANLLDTEPAPVQVFKRMVAEIKEVVPTAEPIVTLYGTLIQMLVPEICALVMVVFYKAEEDTQVSINITKLTPKPVRVKKNG